MNRTPPSLPTYTPCVHSKYRMCVCNAVIVTCSVVVLAVLLLGGREGGGDQTRFLGDTIERYTFTPFL